jgi:hypothetical protein
MLVPDWIVKGGITKVKLRPEQGRSFFVFLADEHKTFYHKAKVGRL